MDAYYSDCFDADPIVKQIDEAVAAIKEALAQPKQKPVAWRTFDGEGGYDYCSYEDNENYADDWNKRNPNHKGWVEPLYTLPPQRTWVGLTDDDTFEIGERLGLADVAWVDLMQAIESKLKQKNGYADSD